MLRHYIREKIIFIFLCLSGASPIYADIAYAGDSADDIVAARIFIDSLGVDISTLVSDSSLSAEAYLREVRIILRDRFDIPVIGQFLLGVYGRGLASEVYDEFLVTMEDYVVLVYGLRLRAYYSGERLQVGDVLEQNGTYLVRSRIDSKDGEKFLSASWRVYRNKAGMLKIIDVILNDVSMIVSQRDEFASIIRNSGHDVGSLILALRATSARVRAEFLQAEG